jgi:hypothetical protein
LRAKTETESIDRVLDLASDKFEKNRRVLESRERFARSGILIREVYGKLADWILSSLFDTSVYISVPRGEARPARICDAELEMRPYG